MFMCVCICVRVCIMWDVYIQMAGSAISLIVLNFRVKAGFLNNNMIYSPLNPQNFSQLGEKFWSLPQNVLHSVSIENEPVNATQRNYATYPACNVYNTLFWHMPRFFFLRVNFQLQFRYIHKCLLLCHLMCWCLGDDCRGPHAHWM